MRHTAPKHDPPLILLADAQDDERDELSKILQAAGLTVVEVAEGSRCLEAFERHAPDLVLLDLELPGAGGVEVCRTLRDLGRADDPPILMLAAPEREADLLKALEARASGFLERPLRAASLALQVRFALSGGSVPERTPAASVSGGPASRAELIELLAGARAAARNPNSHLAVLCLDLNRFTAVLSSTAQRRDPVPAAVVRRVARATTTFCRDRASASVRVAYTGEDRFAILVEGLPRIEDAAKIGHSILEELAHPANEDDSEVLLRASIGIATYPTDNLDAKGLVEGAETAAWAARQQGRDNLQFYSSAMNTQAFERLTLETSLRKAIERDELVTYYQPRVEIASGQVIGMEALIRWKHPELGLVSPAQFIPLAEETGLIVPIGEWVLRTAATCNRGWQEQGLPPIRMSVNLSSVQFGHPGLYPSVMEVLAETGLDPRWLELELTESILMNDADSVLETLQLFRDAGIHLSIDDFGTGYSSLSYLRRFPIDSLKIDQSFIRDVTSNPDDASIATSIILMGRSLKLRVVAEGVETQSQLSFLRVMQCDEAQGYLYSPPVPAEEAVEFLRKGLPNTAA